MKTALISLVKEIQFLSPLRRYFFPRFDYNLNAPQLCFLCRCLERTRAVPGAVVEVGCAAGVTTLFLNKYMDGLGIEKDYFAIDTFSGFVREDIEYEVRKRGKSPDLFTGFQVNKKKWFDGTMKMNGITRVRSIEADVNEFDFSVLGEVSLCILDVDLYRPMKHSLPPLFAAMSRGGILVVDDCDPNEIRWDGSDQAYKEFCRQMLIPERIELGKLGVIEKSSSEYPAVRESTTAELP